MDDEVKNLLKKNLEVNEESLKILKKLHRGAVWGKAWGAVKFLVVVGLLVFSYIQLAPILSNLLNAYNKILNPAVGQNINVKVAPGSLPPELNNLLQGLLKSLK